jgi:hypothetical protein
MLSKRSVIKSGVSAGFTGEVLYSNEETDADYRDFVSVNIQSSLASNILRIPSANLPSYQRYFFSNQYAVFYEDTAGFEIYDLTSTAKLASCGKPTKFCKQLKKGAFSQIVDGMFFFAFDDDPVLYSMLITPSKVEISTPLKLDRPDALPEQHRGKGPIVSLKCHPSKQILFVVYEDGIVQVKMIC